MSTWSEKGQVFTLLPVKFCFKKSTATAIPIARHWKRRFRIVKRSGLLTNEGRFLVSHVLGYDQLRSGRKNWNATCSAVTICVSLAKSRTSWHFCSGRQPSWTVQALALCQGTWVQILTLCFLFEQLWANYLIYLDLNDLSCKMSIILVLICRVVLRMKWFNLYTAHRLMPGTMAITQEKKGRG